MEHGVAAQLPNKNNPAFTQGANIVGCSGYRMEYRNLAAKVLLARQWENQHLVPLEQPASRKAFLRLLSKTVLRPNIEGVEVVAPIFIIGTPRCGSTMMQEILSTHDDIAFFTHSMDMFGDPELFRAADWMRRGLGLDVKGERYLKDSVFVDGGSPSEAMRFWGDSLKLDPYSLTWPHYRIDHFSAEQIAEIKNTLRHVIACFKERGSTRFLNKSPALLTEVLLLQDLFPDARFVHLVRDGRMVANSLIKLFRLQQAQDIKVNHPMFKDHPFVPYPRVPGLEEAAERWGLDDVRTTATVWDSSVKLINSIRPQIRNFYEVRYEDVLAHPREEVQKIFDFCELGPLRAGGEAFERRISGVGIIHHTNKYGDFDVVEEIAGDSLRKYGYLSSEQRGAVQ